MKPFSQIIGIAMLGIQLITATSNVSAQSESYFSESYRAGTWEVMLSPQYMFSKDLEFDGGTTATTNGTWGFGFQLGYNFNDHLNLAGLFSWSNPDYSALLQPTVGNPSPPRNTNGTIQMNTFGLALTYNILKVMVASKILLRS